MTRPARIDIDLNALRHNIQRVRQIAPQSKVLAIAKANAYGHGVERVLAAFADVDAIGACCLEEALEIHGAGFKKPIVLLEGFFDAAELSAICEYNFEMVLHCQQQLKVLEKASLKHPIKVWLKIDTGMHRLGFPPQEVAAVWQRLSACNNVVGPLHLMTHFAAADASDKPTRAQQFAQFSTLTQELAGLHSTANSAAILASPETHADWVRPGIMLYGISPFKDKTGLDHNLKPVMTLSSEIMAIQVLPAGATVGYGGNWICPEAMSIGVVALGYGDGYPWRTKNGTPVLLHGKEVPLVGRVSMDMLTIDLRSAPTAKVGDKVVLWGKGLPVEKIAKAADTIPYELVCGVKERARS